MQRGIVMVGCTMVSIDVPDAEAEVVSGVKWGAIDAFPSPAYWKYQVLARRLEGNPIKYRLGRTLNEEVGACLLGGHGIPASVGLAAYTHLRDRGAFGDIVPTELELYGWLSEPLDHSGSTVRYRFARQKAKYLSAALTKLKHETPPDHSGRMLRDWLMSTPGIGPKTASWIARNWCDADDVAILDIHILRAGRLGGFFHSGLSVERHYLQLEEQFLQLSQALSVRASELDAVIWHEMMSSSATVHKTLSSSAPARPNFSDSRPRTKNRRTNTNQLALIV